MVCVKMIARVADLAQAAHVRVLIAAATNVAVDRLLSALLLNDFEEFLRVGNDKKNLIIFFTSKTKRRKVL